MNGKHWAISEGQLSGQHGSARTRTYVLAIGLVAGLAGTLLTGTITYAWVRHFHPSDKQGGILVALVALGSAPIASIAGAFAAWRAFATASSLIAR